MSHSGVPVAGSGQRGEPRELHRQTLPADHHVFTLASGLAVGYARGPEGQLRFEGPRPGPGWHRHDWRPGRLAFASDRGAGDVLVERRRWRRHGTSETRQDRAPDEVGGLHFVRMVVLLPVAGWLLSGDGLHTFVDPAHAARPHPRAVQHPARLRSRPS